jgi:hypothetical protein
VVLDGTKNEPLRNGRYNQNVPKDFVSKMGLKAIGNEVVVSINMTNGEGPRAVSYEHSNESPGFLKERNFFASQTTVSSQ